MNNFILSSISHVWWVTVDFKILQEGVQLVNFLNMENINTISGSAGRREAAMSVGQEQRGFPRFLLTWCKQWDMTLANLYTTTPRNKSTYPPNVTFMDPMVHILYRKNVLRNFSVQTGPSRNTKTTTIGNANSILYGMDNDGNDVPQQSFHWREECNIENNIKIMISIDRKMPVQISQEQEQQKHEYMPSEFL